MSLQTKRTVHGSNRMEEGPTPKKAKDDEHSGESEIDLHVRVAKPFVLAGFSRKSDNDQVWESLSGTHWQVDQDVCRTAVSFGVCPRTVFKTEKVRRVLHDNPKFVVSLFRCTRWFQPVEALWEMLPKPMQDDTEICFAAVRTRDILPWRFTDKMKSRKIAEAFLSEHHDAWEFLPERYKSDVDLALILAGPDIPYTFHEVEQDVADKVKLWREWACRYPADDRYDWREAPASIMSDKELMRKVISANPSVFRHVALDLAGDAGFVSSVLAADITALAFLPDGTIVRLPSLITIEMISSLVHKAGKGLCLRLHYQLPGSFWNDRAFVLGWLSSGLDFPRYVKPEKFQDEEMILTHAKHYDMGNDYFYPRNLLPDDCIANKDCVMKLLRRVPWAHPVMAHIRDRHHSYHDKEVMLLALAKAPSRYPWNVGAREWLEFQLLEYERFFNILLGMKEGSGSSLVVLNQGPGADVAKRIASYLDFPLGETLKCLFQAGKRYGICDMYPSLTKKVPGSMLRRTNADGLRPRLSLFSL